MARWSEAFNSGVIETDDPGAATPPTDDPGAIDLGASFGGGRLRMLTMRSCNSSCLALTIGSTGGPTGGVARLQNIKGFLSLNKVLR